jgi:molecular chaperone GrpE
VESRPVPNQPAKPDADPTGKDAIDGQAAIELRERDQDRPPVGSGPEPAGPGCQDEVQEWRDRALRLQADMENYRKRQQRLAQADIQSERERLLANFLQIVDDLERALAAQEAVDGVSRKGHRGADNLTFEVGQPSRIELVRGVELTYRSALQLLQKEGVERIEARNQPFDPNWHEAVTTVPRNGHQVASGTVIQVLQPGYRLGDRLLRPAKVVVAL